MRIWPVASGVAWRTLKNVFTNPSLFFPSLIFPLFFFTAFAGGLSQVSEIPGFDFEPGYTAFQFCFVLIQSAAFGGVFTGFGIARDFESGFARRLLLAAPNRTGIVLGYAVAAVLRWAVTAAVLTVVALLAGMNVFGGPVDVFGMYALALLINITGLLWASGVAMRFRTMQAGPVMQMPVFLTLFFAPVYVPLALLTGWIEVSGDAEPDHVRPRGGAEHARRRRNTRGASRSGSRSCWSWASRSGPCAGCVRRRRPARSGTVAPCLSPRSRPSARFRSSPGSVELRTWAPKARTVAVRLAERRSPADRDGGRCLGRPRAGCARRRLPLRARRR